MRDVNEIISHVYMLHFIRFIWTMRDVNPLNMHFSAFSFNRFIWTMRDVNNSIENIKKIVLLCFIWTMRDVNILQNTQVRQEISLFYLNYEGCKHSEGFIPSGSAFLCFIWTMRDVNVNNTTKKLCGCLVLSELWGM